MKIFPEKLNRRESHKLLLSIIVPRPIAFISTVSKVGVFNAAPFSFFCGISSSPPLLAVSISKRRGEKKDTLRNIEQTRDFAINIVTEEIAEKMNEASGDYPPEISEFEVVGLTPVSSELIASPRIKESPVSMECRLFDRIRIGETDNTLIIGEVLLFHIEEAIFAEGEVDARKLFPIGRLGKDTYCRIRDIFKMIRPDIGGRTKR